MPDRSPDPTRPISDEALKLRVDAVINGSLAAGRIVGSVTLVSVEGRIVFKRAAGLMDREATVPMTDDAVFRLASVSKLFVATTGMTLVGQGRLALDSTVDTFLPWFRPRMIDGSEALITIRQLLTHTSGLGYGFLERDDGPYHVSGVSDGMDRSVLTLEENLRRLVSVPLLSKPGSAWTYSLSTDVLGAVIEAVTGQTLPKAVNDLVVRPLGLSATGFGVPDPVRLATAYADSAPRPRRMTDDDLLPTAPGLAGVAMSPARALDSESFPSGGAGMVGTAADTLRLLEALRLGGGPLMPQNVVEEMGKDQIPDLDVAGWAGWGHGLGFTVLRDPAAGGTPEFAGTWRWGGAYGHSWFVDPVSKLTVVAFTNTAFEGMSGGGRFPVDLCRAVYGQ
ncbi:serine hydrolase domain-containing protein [Phyllobacterium sp. SB3]|uniref:serine hydrolase domain-containing protein n=1 Tax=Phyllobacterium sp. SB3 TaxID=3156073 RepID=UPI0032AEE341